MDTRVEIKAILERRADYEDHNRSPLHGHKVAQSVARRYSTALQLNHVARDKGVTVGRNGSGEEHYKLRSR